MNPFVLLVVIATLIVMIWWLCDTIIMKVRQRKFEKHMARQDAKWNAIKDELAQRKYVIYKFNK